MPNPKEDELFVVNKYHIYLVIAVAVSFIAGMVVRSLLLGPMPYYVAGALPTGTSAVATVASPVITGTPGAVVSPTKAPPTPTVVVANVSADDDPYLGPADAPVLIVEFSDFQCPFCARFANETLTQIVDAYPDQVRFVFRDFPLIGMHAYAEKAAEASQCANEQGKYWEYNELLFRNQQALDVPSLKGYAQQLGLDTAAFNSCLDSGEYAAEVQNDIAEGASYGVTGTPTFFVNGHMLVGAYPFSSFKAIIDEELAK